MEAKVGLSPDPDRNLALELVRATEAAAMAAARQLGQAAVRGGCIVTGLRVTLA